MCLQSVLLNCFKRLIAGIAHDAVCLAEVVYRPSVAFDTLKKNPSWVYAFGIVSLVQFAIVLLTEWSNISDRESFILVVTVMLVIVILRNLLVWIFFALLLNFSLQIFAGGKENVGLANVLSIVVHSQVIFLIESIAAILVSLLHWMIGITPDFSVRPLVGFSAADWIVSLPQPLTAFLRGLDLFAIWFLLVASFGLEKMYGLRRRRSSLIILACYCLLLIMKLFLGDTLRTYFRSAAAR